MGSGGGGAGRRPHTGIVKLRGLPFTSREEDIIQWFEDVGLPEAIPLDRCVPWLLRYCNHVSLPGEFGTRNLPSLD